MKKILMTFELSPTDESTTTADVEKLLDGLGSVSISQQAEIEIASAEGFGVEQILYISGDESEPYQLVDEIGEREGEELSEEDISDLQSDGICVAFHAEYPRADQYGTPPYVFNDTHAEAEVAEHLFRVAEEGLSVSSEDRGDDSPAELWLTILTQE